MLRGMERGMCVSCWQYAALSRSTAIEVALKMAFRKFLRGQGKASPKSGGGMCVVGFHGGYHGDTLGAMEAVSPSIYTTSQTPWCV